MKATIQRKFYVTDEEDELIRRKCARAGKSVSRAAAEALLHWQPNRKAALGRWNRPNYGLPARAVTPMRL